MDYSDLYITYFGGGIMDEEQITVPLGFMICISRFASAQIFSNLRTNRALREPA